MGIVSITKGDALYWLGRYAQRTIVLSMEVFQTFDRGVGVDREPAGLDATHVFCESLGIRDRFPDTKRFIQAWFLDHNRDYSMISALQHAYDNVLVLRDLLPLDCFASFRAGYSMLDSLTRPDLFRIREVVEYLYAFWGAFEDAGDETEVAIAHFGRLVERLDLSLRLGQNEAGRRSWARKLERLGAVLDVEVPVASIPDPQTPAERREAVRRVNALFLEVFPHGS
jgi:uncharacterized alpha-E superfamily protein